MGLKYDLPATPQEIAESQGISGGPNEYVLPNPQALLPRVRFSAEAIEALGTARAGMKNPHRHHILEVNGRAGEHRALGREGQEILRSYNIDPLQGNQSGQTLTVVNGDFSTNTKVNEALDCAVVRGNYGGWVSNYAHAQYYFFADGNMIGTFGQLQKEGKFVANLDVNYTPVSGAYPAATPATVVVQTGDTLRSIAGRVYGDVTLWYVIAEENGLTDPDADLADGL
jgi:LysM repeat protein